MGIIASILPVITGVYVVAVSLFLWCEIDDGEYADVSKVIFGHIALMALVIICTIIIVKAKSFIVFIIYLILFLKGLIKRYC